MREYQNRETGEVLTEQEARKQWTEEYDGGDDTNPVPFDEYYDPVYFTYGMRLRGFSPGCQPMNGFVDRRDDTAGRYHDILVYDRRLPDDELKNYELDFIGYESKEEN